MKAKTYFEACGRRDRCREWPPKTLLRLPDWCQEAYNFGYRYQQKRPKR